MNCGIAVIGAGPWACHQYEAQRTQSADGNSQCISKSYRPLRGIERAEATPLGPEGVSGNH